MRKKVRLKLREQGNQVKLTDREKDVLRLLVRGKTYREIATELFVTVNTAREYVTRLCLKLGVNRRSAGVAKAFELGLVDPEPKRNL